MCVYVQVRVWSLSAMARNSLPRTPAAPSNQRWMLRTIAKHVALFIYEFVANVAHDIVTLWEWECSNNFQHLFNRVVLTRAREAHSRLYGICDACFRGFVVWLVVVAGVMLLYWG